LAKAGFPVDPKKAVDWDLPHALVWPQPDGIPVLIRLLKARDVGIRRMAAWGLGNRAIYWLYLDRECLLPAVPGLAMALLDDDETVRTWAREALEKIDPDGVWKASSLPAKTD